MPLYRFWSSQLVFCRKWWPFSIYWEGWYHPSAEKADIILLLPRQVTPIKKKKKKKKKNSNSIGCFTFKFSNHDMPLYRFWSSQLVFCRKWWPFSIYWEGWYHPSAEKADIILLLPRQVTPIKKKKKKKKKKNSNSIGCFTFKFSNHDMPLYRFWSSQLVFCRKWWPFSIYWEGWYHPSAEKADIILLLPRQVTPIKKKKKKF